MSRMSIWFISLFSVIPTEQKNLMSNKNALPGSVPALRRQGGGVFFVGPQLSPGSEDIGRAGGPFPGHWLEATRAVSSQVLTHGSCFS